MIAADEYKGLAMESVEMTCSFASYEQTVLFWDLRASWRRQKQAFSAKLFKPAFDDWKLLFCCQKIKRLISPIKFFSQLPFSISRNFEEVTAEIIMTYFSEVSECGGFMTVKFVHPFSNMRFISFKQYKLVFGTGD